MKRVRTAAIACLMLGMGSTMQAQVLNGGFETGDLTGWINSGNCGDIGLGSAGGHSGTFEFNAGPQGAVCTLRQTIGTTIGQLYTFSFWLDNRSSDGPNSFEAMWGGQSLLAYVEKNDFAYSQHLFSVAATGASTDIEFRFRHDPSFWDLDDVDVAAVNTIVPEPSTVALTAAGLLALAGVVVRRRRA